MVELLSRMLHKWETDAKFNGIKIGRLAPSITYLSFADDVIIFCRVNVEEIRNIQRCLHLHCKWTGQSFNKDKLGCFFSSNVPWKTKASIKRYMGMKEMDKKGKHLGMPMVVEKNKSTIFEDLRKKIESKFQGWKANLLSQTG
nr:uncharacterized protein LOC125419554 [Ziziphus jujuba var. spinosa]